MNANGLFGAHAFARPFESATSRRHRFAERFASIAINRGERWEISRYVLTDLSTESARVLEDRHVVGPLAHVHVEVVLDDELWVIAKVIEHDVLEDIFR